MKKGDIVRFKWTDDYPHTPTMELLDGKEGEVDSVLHDEFICLVIIENDYWRCRTNSLTLIESSTIPDLSTVSLDDLLAEIKRRADQ